MGIKFMDDLALSKLMETSDDISSAFRVDLDEISQLLQQVQLQHIELLDVTFLLR